MFLGCFSEFMGLFATYRKPIFDCGSHFWDLESDFEAKFMISERRSQLPVGFGNPGFCSKVGLEISKVRTAIENPLPTSCKQTHKLTKTAQKHPQRCREVSLEIWFLRANFENFDFGRAALETGIEARKSWILLQSRARDLKNADRNRKSASYKL